MADNLNTTTTSGIEELDNPTDKVDFAFPTGRARKCRGWQDDLPDFAPEFHERFPMHDDIPDVGFDLTRLNLKVFES